MPTYSIQAPDGKTYSIDGPPDASKDDIVRAINYKLYGLPKPEAPPPGAASTFLKSMGMGSIPGAAGLKAFAETTAVAAPEMGPWALIPGLAAAGLTTWGTSKAQDALLQKTGLDKALGVDEESMAKGEKAHPYASLLGEFAAQLETMEPNFKGLKSIKGLSEDLAKEVLEARKTAAANAAIGAVTTAAQQGAFNDGNVDWTDVAKSAALGAILGKPNRFGRYVEGFGHAPKVTPPVGPAVTPEEKAGEYDFLSSAIPSRQKPVEPAQAPIPDWLASNEDIPSYFLKKPPPEPSLQQEPLPSWLTPQANETPAWLYKNPDDFTNPQLPLTRDVTQPNDLFRTHQPIELGGQQPQEPVDLMSRPDSELTDDELAQKNALTRQQGVQQGQMGFPYPRTPMNELAPRERVLQAMRIEEDTKTIKNLQDATGLRPMELRAELNKLKNEGVVGYNAREHEWEFTNKPAEESAELPAQKDVPTQQEVENLVEEKSDLPAQKDVPTREDVEQLLKEEPAAEQPAAEQPAAEQPAAEEAPKVKKTAKPVEEKVAPITRSENAINALREGNLGKALYHLIYEAGGDVGGGLNPALHGTPSPLRALAEALFNVTERTDDRSAIIKTEQSRAAKELGITPDHPSYDKVMQNIADLINNDYDLSKYDFTDADGNLTAAGRLAKDFKPQYERLVPLPKSVKFERSTGRFVDLNGKTINKNAFGNADVFVEGSTKDKDALATLKRIKSEGKVAEYHPETNTFYFTKDGLNDRAILHEMTHAATVKTLHEFANNPDNLTRTQREGAQTINDIYNNSKTRLGKQFPHAYDNVYEFVSHVATDSNFQRALAGVKLSDIGMQPTIKSPSLWDHFTNALSKLLNLGRYAANYLGLDNAKNAMQGDNALLQSTLALKNILATPKVGLDIRPLAAKEESVRDLKTLGATQAHYPEMDSNIKDQALSGLSRLGGALRRASMGMLSGHQLDQLFGKELPIKQLLNVAELHARQTISDHNNLSKIVQDMFDTIKKKGYSKAVLNEFHDIGNQATLHQIEVIPGYRDYDPEAALAKRYKNLPDSLQDIMKTIRDHFDKQGNASIEALASLMETPAAAQKLRMSYESSRLKIYQPLYRGEGDYWLEYRDPKAPEGENIGKTNFTSEYQRERAIEKLRQDGMQDFKPYQRLRDLRTNGAPPTGFLGDVVSALKKAKVSDNVLDDVYEHFLNYLPTQSARQMFREREGVMGFQRDTINAFANVASRMDKMINNIKYQRPFQRAIEDLRFAGDNHPDPKVSEVINNLEQQIELYRNPKQTFTARASKEFGSFGYTWYLAGNASSAFVNYTHLPMVVYPLVGGKYGYVDGGAALLAAQKRFIANHGEVPQGYEKLYESALNQAALGDRRERFLDSAKKTSVEDYSGTWNNVKDKLDWMFMKADHLNRESTLMATYDLEMKQPNATPEKAIEAAIQMTKDAYGSTLSGVGPRFLQHPLGNVVFMFKKFAMNRYFLLGKLFNQAFRGADSNTRSIARSQMLGILGTSFAMAGVAGMPLVGAGQFLANLIMSDEDHPYDSEEEMKNAMGDLAYKGPINHMLNLDVSDRVGWNNMLWKDDPRRLAEVGAFDYFMERSIGVPYTMYSQGAEAFKHFKAGEYEKTAEAVAPAFVKNGLRMFDLATQGAVNSRGEKLADAEGGFNLLSQGLGFAPADVAEARARATAMSVEQKAIVNRRQALFDQLYAAKMAGSDEDYYKLMEDVEKFNNRNPDYPITGLQIIRSIQGREKQSRDAVMGVHLNRKLRDSLMEEYANPETL